MVNSALVVSSTAAIKIWRDTHLPIVALIISVFGIIVSALPIASQRDERQRSLAVIADCLSEAEGRELLPIVLPTLQRTKLQAFSDNAALVFISSTILVLILHAAFVSTPLCQELPLDFLTERGITVCAPDL